MVDQKRPFDVAEASNPVLQQAFTYFCRHLVSLACRCDPIDASGKPIGEPQFFGFSGQILSVRGSWSLLTAGHILKGIECRLKSGTWKLQFFLADHFGPGVINHQAIPFDYEAAPKAYIDQDGLDFGLVSIRPYYRALLQANGVVPISEENWVHQHAVEFDRHLMLGFPTELIETTIRQTRDGYELTGSLSPTMAYVTKFDSPPTDAPPTPFPRFVGQVGHGGLHDIDGMSGCPIFGFEKGRNDQYWIVAIQNSWFPKRRIIFGTPVPVLGQFIEEALEEQEVGRNHRE